MFKYYERDVWLREPAVHTRRFWEGLDVQIHYYKELYNPKFILYKFVGLSV